MKQLYLLVIIAQFVAQGVLAQNVGINGDGSTPDPNAMLDVRSGSKGLLIPRMDSVSRKGIPNTKGLLVYDTTSSSFWYNDGTKWNSLAPGTAGWSLADNGNTDTAHNFIGTIDAHPLVKPVQELKAQNDALSAENRSLKKQFADLSARIDALEKNRPHTPEKNSI